MREYIIDDQVKLIVGESPKENTELVKSAHPERLWVHLDGTSSASGIIETSRTLYKRDFNIIKWLFLEHHSKGKHKVLCIKVKYVTPTTTPGLFEIRKRDYI